MNTMFCEFCKVSSLFLFVVCVSYCSASGREVWAILNNFWNNLAEMYIRFFQALFGFEEDTIKACMEEKSVTEDQVKEMEEAEEADEANACFFGCMLNKEGFVSFYFSSIQISKHIFLDIIFFENKNSLDWWKRSTEPNICWCWSRQGCGQRRKRSHGWFL